MLDLVTSGQNQDQCVHSIGAPVHYAGTVSTNNLPGDESSDTSSRSAEDKDWKQGNKKMTKPLISLFRILNVHEEQQAHKTCNSLTTCSQSHGCPFTLCTTGQLNRVMSTLRSTAPHVVRRIAPNDFKKPGQPLKCAH